MSEKPKVKVIAAPLGTELYKEIEAVINNPTKENLERLSEIAPDTQETNIEVSAEEILLENENVLASTSLEDDLESWLACQGSIAFISKELKNDSRVNRCVLELEAIIDHPLINNNPELKSWVKALISELKT